jgi:hypothetical protein
LAGDWIGRGSEWLEEVGPVAAMGLGGLLGEGMAGVSEREEDLNRWDDFPQEVKKYVDAIFRVAMR